MDTPKTPDEKRAKVEADIARIKAQMPRTYQAIQAKAAEVGNAAYAWVKRACAGEPDLFYAMEAGHVVGAPFAQPDLQRDLAHAMVTFGIDYLVVWPAGQAEPKGGA
jgi:hypothetical protein